jgi:hypothetical protein
MNNNDEVRYTEEGPIYTHVPDGYVIYNPSGEKKHGPLNPYFPGEKLPGNGILIDDVEWVLQDYESWYATYGNLAIRKPGEELTEQEEEERIEGAKRKLNQLLEQEKEEQQSDIEINLGDEEEQQLKESEEESDKLKEEEKEEEQEEVEEEEAEEIGEDLDFLGEFEESLNDFLETFNIDDVLEEEKEKSKEEEDWIDIDISFEDDEDLLEEPKDTEDDLEEEFPEDVFQINEEERERLATLKLLEDSRIAIGKILKRLNEALKKDYYVSLEKLVDQDQLEEILSWVKIAEELYKKLDEYYFEENLDEEVLRQLFRQVDDVSSFLEKSLAVFEDAYWMMNEWTKSHPSGFGKYLFSKITGFLKDRFGKLSDASKQFKRCIEKYPDGSGKCREEVFNSIKEDSKLNLIKGKFLKSPSHYNLFADVASVVKVTNKKTTIAWRAAQDVPYLAGNFLLYLLRNFDLKHLPDGSLELTISSDTEEITYRFSPYASELLTLIRAFSAQDKSINGKLLFEMLARLSAESRVSYSTFNYEGKVEYQEEVSLFEFLLRSLGFNKTDANFIMAETFRPGGIIDVVAGSKDSIRDALRDVYAAKIAKQVSEAFFIDHSSDLDLVRSSIRSWEIKLKKKLEDELKESASEIHTFEEESYEEVDVEDVLEEILEEGQSISEEAQSTYEKEHEEDEEKTYVEVTKGLEEITSEILDDLEKTYGIKARDLDDAIVKLLDKNPLDESITLSVLLDSLGTRSLMLKDSNKALSVFLRLISFLDKNGEILDQISNDVRNGVDKAVLDLTAALSSKNENEVDILLRKNAEALNNLVKSLYYASQQIRENKESIKDNKKFIADALKNIIVLSSVSSSYIQNNGDILSMSVGLREYAKEVLDRVFGTDNQPGEFLTGSLEEFKDSKTLVSFVKDPLLKAYIPLNLNNVRKVGIEELPIKFSAESINFSKLKDILESVEIDGKNFRFKTTKNVSISGDPDEFFKKIVFLATKEISETGDEDIADYSSIKFNYAGVQHELIITRTAGTEDEEDSTRIDGKNIKLVKGWKIEVTKGDDIVVSRQPTSEEFDIINRAPSLSGNEASKALKTLLRSVLGYLEKESIKEHLSSVPVIENINEIEEAPPGSEIPEEKINDVPQETGQGLEEQKSETESISGEESAESREKSEMESEAEEVKGAEQETLQEKSKPGGKQTNATKPKKEKKKTQKDEKVDENLGNITEESIKDVVEKAVKNKPSKAKTAKTVSKLYEAEQKIKTGVLSNLSRHVTPDGSYYSTSTDFEKATFADVMEVLNQKNTSSLLVYGEREEDFDGAIIVEKLNNKNYRITLAPSTDFANVIFGNKDKPKAGKKIERLASITLSSKDLEALKGANIHSVMSELLKTNKVLDKPVFEGEGGFEDLPLLARTQEDIGKMTLEDVLTEDENTQIGARFSFALDEETGENIFDYSVYFGKDNARFVLRDSSGNVVYEKVFLGKDFENLKNLKIKDIFDTESIQREATEQYRERKKKEKEEEKKRRLSEFLNRETRDLAFSEFGIKGNYELSGDKVHYYFERDGKRYSVTVPLNALQEVENFEGALGELAKRKVEEEQKQVEQSSIGEEDFKFALEDLFSGKIDDLRIKTGNGFVMKLKGKGKDEVSFELYDPSGRFIKSISQDKKSLLSGGLTILARAFKVLSKPAGIGDSEKFVSFINYRPIREAADQNSAERQVENTEKRSKNLVSEEEREVENKEENKEKELNQAEGKKEEDKVSIDKEALKSAVDEVLASSSTTFEALYGGKTISIALSFNGGNIWTIVLPPKGEKEESKRMTFNAKEYCKDYDPYEITEDLLECISNAIIEKISQEY